MSVDAPPVDAVPNPGDSGTGRFRFRLTLADGLMLVVAAASASALWAEIYRLIEVPVWHWKQDSPTLVVLAIVLTAIALGSYKAHSFGQILLQVTIACLGYLSLIWLSEANELRLLLYWLQGAFGLTVALPMAARRYVKSSMPRGPRRRWWKNTLESVVFSFITVHLIALGWVIQWLTFMLGQAGGLIQA